jgi:hypothetical protein
MIEVVLGVAVFVLAAAVIGLFAMMGELASRQPDRIDASPDRPSPTHLHQVAEARLGAAPPRWPDELAPVRDADLAHVVVFGSTCASCERIASGETGPLTALPAPLAVVVSCPRAEDGAAFLARHPMVADHPHLVDVGGAWLIRNFEVGISPSVLVFTRGRLRSAHTFTAAAALSHLPGPDDHEEARDVHAAKTTG